MAVKELKSVYSVVSLEDTQREKEAPETFTPLE